MLSKLFTVIGLFFVLTDELNAQAVAKDTTFVESAMTNQRIQYLNFLRENSSLYRGSEYKEFLLKAHDQGNPYLLSNKWIIGSIYYSGQHFQNVELLYDAVNNKVVTHPLHSFIKMELIHERIGFFTLGDRVFVKLEESQDPNSFYELLVDGLVKLYVSRRKVIVDVKSGNSTVHVFEDHPKYFLLKEGVLMAVKSKRGFFKIIPEHKSEIKRNLTQKEISFWSDFENALINGVLIHNTAKND